MRQYCIIFSFVLVLMIVVNIKVSAQNTPIFYDLRNGQALYADFIKKYKKTFSSRGEYKSRYMNFMRTLRHVNEINSQSPNKVTPNQFADLSETEKIELIESSTKKVDPELQSMATADDMIPNVLEFFTVI